MKDIGVEIKNYLYEISFASLNEEHYLKQCYEYLNEKVTSYKLISTNSEFIFEFIFDEIIDSNFPILVTKTLHHICNRNRLEKQTSEYKKEHRKKVIDNLIK